MSAEIRHIQTKISASAEGFEQTLKGLNKQIEGYTKEANRVLDSLPERLAAALQAGGAKQVSAQRDTMAKILQLRQELGNREKKLALEAHEYQAHLIRQEAEKQKAAVNSEVANRLQATKLIVQIERVASAEIAKLHSDAATRRAADANRAAQAEIAAVERAKAAAIRAAQEERQARLRAYEERIAKARQAAQEERAARQNLAMVGVGLGVAGGAGAAGIGKAVAEYAQFEHTITKIGAVSDSTSGELMKLREAAITAGQATGLGAQQAAEGLNELVLAGFTTTESLAALNSGMLLAKAGGVEVAQAMDLVGGSIRGFGLAAEDAARVSDIMAATANKSAVNIHQIQLSMKYIAPIAQTAGQSIEEMAAAIAIMGNNMIRGEQAGTSMRGALVRLTDPPKEAADALHKLGISVQDNKGKMLDLGTILEQIRRKTENLTQVQKNQALSQIFGTEALSGMLSLVNAGAKGYDKMVKEMHKVNGQTQIMADKMNQGLAPALTNAGNALAIASAAFGEQFAPSVEAAAKMVSGMSNYFTGMNPVLKALAAGVATATVAVLSITGAISVLALTAGPAMLALGGLGIAVGSLAAPFAVAAGAVALLSLGLGGYVIASKLAQDTEYQHKRSIEIATVELEKWNGSLVDSRDRLFELVNEHDNLIDKTNRTTAENERLDAITKILNKEYPQLTGALSASAGGHWAIIAAVRSEIAMKDALIRTNIKVAQTSLAAAQAKLGQTKAAYAINQIDADTARQQGRRSDPRGAYAVKASALQNEANRAKSLIAVRELEVKQFENTIRNMNSQLENSAMFVGPSRTPSAVPAYDPSRFGAPPPSKTKTRKGRSGAGAARAAQAAADRGAREDYKIDEALATEQFKQAEEAAKRLTSINKAAIERQLADLQNAKERGRITETDYTKQVEALKQKQIAQEEALALYVLGLERQKTQLLLKEAQNAGKVKHTEQVKLAAQLVTLDGQRLSIEADFNDRRKGQAQATAHAIEAAELAKSDKIRKFDEDLAASREALDGESLRNRLAAIERDYAARERAAANDPELSGRVGEIKAQKAVAIEKAKYDALKAAQAVYADSREADLNNLLSKEYDAYVNNLKSMVAATDENAPAITKALTDAYTERVEAVTTKFYRGQLDQLENYIKDAGSTWERLSDPAASAFDRIGIIAQGFYATFKDQIANALMPTLNNLWVSIGGEGVKAILASGQAWAKSAIEAAAAAVSFTAARIAMGDPIAIIGAGIAGIALVVGAATAALKGEAERQREAAEAAKTHAIAMDNLNASLSKNIVLKAQAAYADKVRQFDTSDPVKEMEKQYADTLAYIELYKREMGNEKNSPMMRELYAKQFAMMLDKKIDIELAYQDARKMALAEAGQEIEEAQAEQAKAVFDARQEYEITAAENAGNTRLANDIRMRGEYLETSLKFIELEKQGILEGEEYKTQLAAAHEAIRLKYFAEGIAARVEAMEKLNQQEEAINELMFSKQRAQVEMDRSAGKLGDVAYVKKLAKVEEAEDRSQVERLTKSAEYYNALAEQSAGNLDKQLEYNQKAMEAAGKAQAIIAASANKARAADEDKTNAKFKRYEDKLKKQLAEKERAFELEARAHEDNLVRLDKETRKYERQLEVIRERIRVTEEERDKEKLQFNKEDKGKFTKALAGTSLGDVDTADLGQLAALRAKLESATANNQTGLADSLRQDIGDLQRLTFEGIENQQKINENRLELEEISQEDFTKIAVGLALKKAKLAEAELKDERISVKEKARIQAILADAYTEWREVQLELIDKQAEGEINLQLEEERTISKKLSNLETERRETNRMLEDIRNKYNEEVNKINRKIADNKAAWDTALADITKKTYTSTNSMVIHWDNVSSAIQKAINKANELAAAQNQAAGGGGRNPYTSGPGGGAGGYRAMASGGWVEGGTPGKDSVKIMAMPGEHITDVSLSAGLVEMVNYFRQLVSQSSQMALAGANGGGGGTYVVNNFKFQDVVIRDDRDINTLVDEVSTRIARQY